MSGRPSSRRIVLAVGLAVGLLAWTKPGRAQDTHLVVISGIGGAPEYVDLFHDQALTLVDAALMLGLAEERIVWLAEDPGRLPGRITDRSTREALEREMLELAERLGPEDRVFILMIGHGTADGESAKLNLPGPDVRAEDLAGWLAGLQAAEVAVVNTASASGGFLEPLGAEGRIVITATRSSREAERTHFAEFFVAAFDGQGADVDKDGRVSLREAYDFARTAVERRYEREGQLLTEHAVLQEVGVLASRFHLAGPAAALGEGEVDPADPRVAALVTEKDRLERAIADIRERRSDMEEAAYERALEELLVDLAGVNAELRGEEAP